MESIYFWRIGGHERAIDFDRRTFEIASLLSSLVSSQSDVVLQLVEMRINEL